MQTRANIHTDSIRLGNAREYLGLARALKEVREDQGGPHLRLGCGDAFVSNDTISVTDPDGNERRNGSASLPGRGITMQGYSDGVIRVRDQALDETRHSMNISPGPESVHEYPRHIYDIRVDSPTGPLIEEFFPEPGQNIWERSAPPGPLNL